MAEEFNQIDPPLGFYAISGNHEYKSEDPLMLERYLTSNKHVKYLRDSCNLVDDAFYIIGRDDLTNRNRATLYELTQNCDNERPIIVIDHQPKNLVESQQNKVSLQLSGHTHGGQFFPITPIVKFIYENSYGYSNRGNTHYFVSSGLGVLGPQCRFGSNSEIVVINFRI
jgi:predicted MPP superfamily phosphohydrolase